MRNCSLRAISPFPKVFSKGLSADTQKQGLVWEKVKQCTFIFIYHSSAVVCNFPEVVEFSTSTPSQLEYVYEDVINYTCIFGYEMTSGNASRQCDKHAEWTGTLPNCTSKFDTVFCRYNSWLKKYRICHKLSVEIRFY